MINWRDRRSTVSVLPVITSSLIYIIFPQPLTLSLFCIVGAASVRMALRKLKNSRKEVGEQKGGRVAKV